VSQISATLAAAGTTSWSLGLRVLVALERVDGLADGLYEYLPASDTLEVLRPGRLLMDVQDAFSYPPSSVSVATLNMAWLLCVDYPDIIRRRGPGGFREANLEMGATAQAIGVAVAAWGLFARPCRSYHEANLDPLLGLPASETVGYEVLCGVSRFRDLCLDLEVW
jgi:hypothetical protein